MSRILYSLQEVPQNQNFVITQGTFDGVHLGHKHVLNQVISVAKTAKLPSLLLTFHPHPRFVINPGDTGLKLLNSIEEKAKRLIEFGIDYVLVLPFTEEISHLSPEKFVKNILVDALNVHTMVVGYDHRFGHHRSGGFQELVSLSEIYQFRVQEIAANEIDDVAVSSTRIRKALSLGNLDEANALLGQPYALTGTVVKGKQLGRTIGFPTANLSLDEPHKLIPPNGVYMGWCTVDGKAFKIMVNIGVRPTVDGTYQTIEAHLLDFDGDLYDKKLSYELVQFLRPEKRFEGLDALTQQLKLDKISTENAILA